MESYGEWRVTVYDIIFGELKSHHLTTRIIWKTNLGELAVNVNSPNC